MGKSRESRAATVSAADPSGNPEGVVVDEQQKRVEPGWAMHPWACNPDGTLNENWDGTVPFRSETERESYTGSLRSPGSTGASRLELETKEPESIPINKRPPLPDDDKYGNQSQQ